jgi:hypothetical protein
LGRVDHEAARALDAFINGQGPFTNELISGWSRFLMSLLRRQPAKIQALWNEARIEFERSINTRYSREKFRDYKESRLQSYDEYIAEHREEIIGQLFVRVLRIAIDSQNIGSFLNAMHKTIYTIREIDQRVFLTSDNPLIMSNGLADPNMYIAIPITPKKLFIASHQAPINQMIVSDLESHTMIAAINEMVVRNAYQFVYAEADTHRAFIDHHWAPDCATRTA